MSESGAGLEPLLLSAAESAMLCRVALRTWWVLHAGDRCPLPVRLGRRTLWRRNKLAAWIAAGCPARDRWEAMKEMWA